MRGVQARPTGWSAARYQELPSSAALTRPWVEGITQPIAQEGEEQHEHGQHGRGEELLGLVRHLEIKCQVAVLLCCSVKNGAMRMFKGVTHALGM